jgi:hypothetical protein
MNFKTHVLGEMCVITAAGSVTKNNLGKQLDMVVFVGDLVGKAG